MTERQKRAVTLSVLLAVLGATVVPIARAAWGAKLDTTDFQLHVQEERTHLSLDSARAERQETLLLDVLCGVKPADRRCR